MLILAFMNNAEFILLLVVGSLLALFILILVIVALVALKILKKFKHISTKAENVADSVESAASSVESAAWNLKRSASPLSALKLISSMFDGGFRGRKRR